MRPFLVALGLLLASHSDAHHWTKLPTLPDTEGFAGAFAGVSRDNLLVAGGANFPEKKPWEGGTKIWYDDIFVLSKPNSSWKTAGRLPHPLAYGVSVTWKDSLICIGGSDAKQHYREVIRLTVVQEQLTIDSLASLPVPIANGCGAVVGHHVYVVGGQASPTATTASKQAFRLDLSKPESLWEPIADCPGPGRMLSIAASCDNALWIVGGVALRANEKGEAKRQYLQDAYRYDDSSGWIPIDDFPTPIAAAASPAPSNRDGFFLMGGDDGSQVGIAPARHLGFSKKILFFDIHKKRWQEAGTVEAPRVTLPTAHWNDAWMMISGEMRPGIRSPEVWSFKPEAKP